jgi:transcriptional regulator with XRE-family HTH domain
MPIRFVNGIPIRFSGTLSHMPKLTHSNPVGIGARVHTARKDSGLNQIELAKKAGIRQSTLSELETSGQKSVAADVAFLIAKTCGVRLEWLLFGTGPQRDAGPIGYAQILDDWAVLSDEAREDLLTRLRELADAARRLGPPVGDTHVAKHLPPAPRRKTSDA